MNLEVLKDAAGKLHDRRLFGKIDEVVARCALVQEANLPEERDDVRPRIEYVTGLVQMWVEYETGVAKRFSLVIPDPGKAALAKGRLLQVTVLSADGTPTTADFATAATLTFLREVLGLPLTAAATLYRELLQQPSPVRGKGLFATGCASGSKRQS